MSCVRNGARKRTHEGRPIPCEWRGVPRHRYGAEPTALHRVLAAIGTLPTPTPAKRRKVPQDTVLESMAAHGDGETLRADQRELFEQTIADDGNCILVARLEEPTCSCSNWTLVSAWCSILNLSRWACFSPI